jgi:uncharacterized membrane protein
VQDFPRHVEETVQTLAEIHRLHHTNTRPSERFVARLTGRMAQPGFLIFVTAIFSAWVIANLLLSAWSAKAPDPPPFTWMFQCASLFGVYATLLILISQRREREWAHQRDQLTLELAMLSERKTAKIIQLLEEFRRDHPDMFDREDHEANAMSEPANTRAVGEALLEPDRGVHSPVAAPPPAGDR